MSAAQLAEIERFHIEHACARVYHQLAIAADAAFEGYEDCFTTDVVWVRPAMEMHGHGEMRAFLDSELERMRRENPPHGHLTRHMYTTVYIRAIDRQTARGKASAFVYRDERFSGSLPAPMSFPEVIAAYESNFQKTNDGWKISRHSATHIFRR